MKWFLIEIYMVDSGHGGYSWLEYAFIQATEEWEAIARAKQLYPKGEDYKNKTHPMTF